MKLVEAYLLKRLIGQSSELVILSLMTFSSMISIVTETEDNAVHMKVKDEIAVQAAIGIVIVDLGVEASGDMGVLEISRSPRLQSSAKRYGSGSQPLSVQLASSFTHYVYDSHYTLLI